MDSKRLTESQIQQINSMIREHGAANLEVACRKNKSSWTVGFRVWNPGSDTGFTMSCFRIPFDEQPDIPALTSEIERHLDVCMLNPEAVEEL